MFTAVCTIALTDPCADRNEIQSTPFQSYFSKTCFNIILTPSVRSFKRSFSFRFPYENPVCTCFLSPPSHPSWSDHLGNVRWGLQITNLVITQFFPIILSLSPSWIQISSVYVFSSKWQTKFLVYKILYSPKHSKRYFSSYLYLYLQYEVLTDVKICIMFL